MFVRRIAEVFNLLSDETRLEIVLLLMEEEMCVCELCYVLDRSQSLISHHLRLLKASGIVKSEREGKWIKYAVEKKEEISFLFELLKKVKLPETIRERMDRVRVVGREKVSELTRKNSKEDGNVQGT